MDQDRLDDVIEEALRESRTVRITFAPQNSFEGAGELMTLGHTQFVGLTDEDMARLQRARRNRTWGDNRVFTVRFPRNCVYQRFVRIMAFWLESAEVVDIPRHHSHER